MKLIDTDGFMGYFFHTLINGLRLYAKCSIYIAALTIIFITPLGYLFFKTGLTDAVLKSSYFVINEWVGLQSSQANTVASYSILISALYLPAAVWIASIAAASLAVSGGYFPSFKTVLKIVLNKSFSIFIARLIAQLIALIPLAIIGFFCSNFTHILPMYGQVIIPAVSYFTLYITLRYTFVEVIIICEQVGPLRALKICSRITDGHTLRIFILQQAYLFSFIIINSAIYLLLHRVLSLSAEAANVITSTLLGSINSFLVVVTLYIYLSFAVGEHFSNVEANCQKLFGK